MEEGPMGQGITAASVIGRRFQDGDYREEAENVPPIVKSWRDAGDTPCRQNH
jgi:hypothetical protein